MSRLLAAVWIAIALSPNLWTAEPVENLSSEQLAEKFSLITAVDFLEQASLDWTQSRKCFTCHTNYVHLLVPPAPGKPPLSPSQQQVRSELEKLVEQRWEKPGPRWDAEVVMSAAILAMHDAATTGRLHPATRKALDRMWTLQRADGGFDWLKCGWPPMESDDDFAIPMAALAVAAAPESYRESPAAQAGIAKLKSYLQTNPPPTLHHSAMLIWPERYGLALLSPEAREQTVERLWSLQKGDGGWNSATLGQWERADGQQQDIESSDGYGTGFVLFILQQAGAEASDEGVIRGRAWLEANQRASGRWHTRSLNKDNKHYLSHAGTAFAIMALSQP